MNRLASFVVWLSQVPLLRFCMGNGQLVADFTYWYSREEVEELEMRLVRVG